MKGLLVKDLRLFTQRKSFFIILIAALFIIGTTDSSAAFLISYFTIVLSVFVSSSVTYDEHDNCYPFLFSLPVTRKNYAQEKYLFGLLMGLAGDLFATLFAVLISLFKKEPLSAELFEYSLTIIPFFLLFNAVTLPITLKFGVEKSRIGMLAAGGIIVGLSLLITENDSDMFSNIFAFITAHKTIVSVGFFALAVILDVLSYMLSIRIMKKKEM